MKKQGMILIVDDTEMNRSLLADMLSEDYEILEAANGVEASAILAPVQRGARPCPAGHRHAGDGRASRSWRS